MEMNRARLAGGVVEILQGEEYIPANDVPFLVIGAADSAGVAFSDGVNNVYIANTQPDLQFTLEKLVAQMDEVIAALGSLYITDVEGAAPIFTTPFIANSQAIQAINDEITEHNLI